MLVVFDSKRFYVGRLIFTFLFAIFMKPDVALATGISYGGEEISIVSELPRRFPFLLQDGTPLHLGVIYKAIKVASVTVRTSDHRWVFVNQQIPNRYYQIPIELYGEINKWLPQIDLKNPSKYAKK
jgi:hypothetical protein